MTLTITSAVKVREPGFSRSECLELARRIDCEYLILCNPCGKMLEEAEHALIVAALRAYASE